MYFLISSKLQGILELYSDENDNVCFFMLLIKPDLFKRYQQDIFIVLSMFVNFIKCRFVKMKAQSVSNRSGIPVVTYIWRHSQSVTVLEYQL